MKTNPPQCEMGYTPEELKSILDTADYLRMVDEVQTEECKSRFFDAERQKYFYTDCGPHGAVYPFRRVEKWLEGHQLQSSQ